MHVLFWLLLDSNFVNIMDFILYMLRYLIYTKSTPCQVGLVLLFGACHPAWYLGLTCHSLMVCGPAAMSTLTCILSWRGWSFCNSVGLAVGKALSLRLPYPTILTIFYLLVLLMGLTVLSLSTMPNRVNVIGLSAVQCLLLCHCAFTLLGP